MIDPNLDRILSSDRVSLPWPLGRRRRTAVDVARVHEAVAPFVPRRPRFLSRRRTFSTASTGRPDPPDVAQKFAHGPNPTGGSIAMSSGFLASRAVKWAGEVKEGSDSHASSVQGSSFIFPRLQYFDLLDALGTSDRRQ